MVRKRPLFSQILDNSLFLSIKDIPEINQNTSDFQCLCFTSDCDIFIGFLAVFPRDSRLKRVCDRRLLLCASGVWRGIITNHDSSSSRGRDELWSIPMPLILILCIEKVSPSIFKLSDAGSYVIMLSADNCSVRAVTSVH